MKTLIVIPTYNERENLEMLVVSVLGLRVQNLAILIVDDASPDGTGALADTLVQMHPERISVMHREGKRGLGSAYLDGFRIGIERGFEAICEMDADGSHDPTALPRLIDEIEQGSADVTIGSRRVPGGETIGWGPHRHLMSRGAMLFARFVLGLRTHDVTSGFRCYRASVIKQLLDRVIVSNGYAFQEETLFYCEKLGFRVSEVPIIFRDRTRGQSKLSWSEVPEFFVTVLRLRRRQQSFTPPCPVCGTDAATRFIIRTQEAARKKECYAAHCDSCGSLFLEDYAVDRTSIYGDDYATWGRSVGSDEAMVAAAKHEAFRHQFAAITPFLKNGRRRLLDIGTGNGYLLDVAAEFGFECNGVELSPSAARKASERFPGKIFTGTLEHAAYADGTFDVIAMTDVIEHLSQPNTFLDEVRRIAAPNALLFIITPDAASPSRILLGRHWFQYKYEHVIYYTPASLAMLLSRHGFDTRLSRHNTKRFTLAYYERYFKKYSFLGPLGKIIALLCGLVPASLKERPFTNPVSGEMLVIAMKR